MTHDLTKYRAHMDGMDLSDAEKDRLIHSLWGVMESFADLAFHTHPLQQARPGHASQIGAIARELLESQHTKPSEFTEQENQ